MHAYWKKKKKKKKKEEKENLLVQGKRLQTTLFLVKAAIESVRSIIVKQPRPD